MSRLRKALPPDTLVTRSPGYTIRLGPDQLDLYRFERLVEEARRCLADGRPTDASERLREALALWRGPALADVSYESFAQAAIARLEEIRLAALELRIEADLALGQDRELVGELEALVAEHPLRERLRGHLMLALYRSGRQAEALNAYQDARRISSTSWGSTRARPCRSSSEGFSARTRLSTAQRGGAGARSGRRAVDPRRRADESRLDALLAVAEPLARHPLAHDPGQARPGRGRARTGGRLARQAPLGARSSRRRRPHGLVHVGSPGEELARLASELDVDLLLADAPDELLAEGVPDEELAAVLAGTPCDVALLVPREAQAQGAVLVPFGGADHDWAAVELGAWLARAAACRSASRAPPPCPSRASATRAACSLTRRWPFSGCWACLPSRC